MTQIYATSIRRTEFFALATICVLLLGGGGGLTLAKLSGAVVAPGSVIVETNSRKVQHVDGGTVAEIRVRIGDHVNLGDVLLRLDPTEAQASLEILEDQLAEANARKQRLVCESVACPALAAHPPLKSGASRAESQAWSGQAQLLEARRDIRTNKKRQFIERIAQLNQAREALLAQAKSNDRQLELAVSERAALDPLVKAHNVPLSRIFATQREEERLNGETYRLKAELQRVEAQVAEARLQIIEVDQSNIGEVLAEIRDVETKQSELVEKITAIKARRDRTVIVAPSAGIVHNLTATTVRGVVKPGEVIAEIVPQDEPLIVEARVEAAAVDRLQTDQPAHVRFTAFDQRTTPLLMGKVSLVAPDANRDERTGQPYYVVQTKLELGEVVKLGPQSLRPGMPCEVQFQTGERTILSYLMKPFADQISRAMRER